MTKVFRDEGYGFIRGANGVSYFFHASSVAPRGIFDGLEVGNEVEFVPERHPRGLRAVDVVPQVWVR